MLLVLGSSWVEMGFLASWRKSNPLDPCRSIGHHKPISGVMSRYFAANFARKRAGIHEKQTMIGFVVFGPPQAPPKIPLNELS